MLHYVTVDFAGGNFVGSYYCRDQCKTHHWTKPTFWELKRVIEKFFVGCKYRMAVTSEARSRMEGYNVQRQTI